MIIALQTLIFFRQSLLSALDRFLRPYYKQLTLKFSKYSPEDEEEEEEVFADFDDEKGVIFFPPVYLQRYAAVSDCLMDERWCGKLEKVVDLGYHDMSFIKYLKELPGINCILGVDIECIPLRCSSDLLGCDEYAPKREHPLQVILFEGNAADPDYRLIGCDAVVAIEMIEHMLPHDLDRLVHTVFGFIKPRIAIFTTPNSDFNVLFKALEKNGLRRLDHFFEWSREQFHDWCSNIITRYPQFTVSCQGIGPGPPGTAHLGCCSQLALFVNEKHVKQKDLNINSLALVSNVPSPQNVAEMVGGWESPVMETDILYPQENVESLTDFLYSDKQSCVTILIASPSYSLTAIEYKDKMSQCNLDTEIGKNFLMFNEEDMCVSVLAPRRKINNRVYEIEDVNSRLNCTTFQVTKFSKTTQNLMAKNRIDSLVHTREVVSEIKHLTKMLNLNNRDALTAHGEKPNIWCNINWGENAPYWNQYYKIVREYNYPFETKSEDCRILDLISEEINRLIDAQCDEEFSTDVNKLEIPIEQLMKVVRHITGDVERVKDILEWNGYEIVGDIVVHSRLVVENTSVVSCDEDWTANDTLSDLDVTDVHSTTVSDGSTVMHDFHGHCLRRALDKKVRALYDMLSAEDDITTELDKVVCRLMKLALRSSKGKQGPPPPRWMQCKLLDLLTLTEKAISKRRRHYLENFNMKSITFGQMDTQIIDISKMKIENQTARRIMDQYYHLLQETDNGPAFDVVYDFEDEFDDREESKEIVKDFNKGDIKFKTTSEILKNISGKHSQEELPWYREDTIQTLSYVDRNTKTLSSSEQSTSNGERYRHRKPNKRSSKTKDRREKKTRKRSYSKIADEKTRQEDKYKSKKSKTALTKKVSHMKSNLTARYFNKQRPFEYSSYGLKRAKAKDTKKLLPTASKPIPGSLIEFCHPELVIQRNICEIDYGNKELKCREQYPVTQNNMESYKDVAATEESVFIDIILDDAHEKIALRRSIGTDPEIDVAAIEQECHVTDINKSDSLHNKLHVDTDITPSQTIFLYDINEPSTSKGIRHVSMDVQCGPDANMSSYEGQNISSGFVTGLPKLFSNGIKIENSLSNVAPRNSEVIFTATDTGIQSFDPDGQIIYSRNIFSKGVKIDDSVEKLNKGKLSLEIGTSTNGVISPNSSPNFRKANRITSLGYNQCNADSASRFKCKSVHTSDESEDYRISPRVRSPIKRCVGFKIKDSKTRLLSTSADFCGSPINVTQGSNTISPRSNSPDTFRGIKIDDSLTNMLANVDSSRSNSPEHQVISNFPLDQSRKGSPICTHDERIKKSICHNMHSNANSIFNSLSRDFKDSQTNKAMSVVETKISKFPEEEYKLQTPEDGNECREMGTCTNINSPKKTFIVNRDSHSRQKFDFGTSTEVPLENYDEICKYSIGVGTTFKEDNENNKSQEYLCDSTLKLKTRSFGFKIKGTEENIIKKIEISTNRVELISEGNYYPPVDLASSTKTELLKAASSGMKTEDSSSEFYGSNYCSTPNALHITNESKIDPSLSRNNLLENKGSPIKNIRRKLSCGGIHVHSYKEKQSSEDIVFQGEWQRQYPKLQRKTLQTHQVCIKKSPDLVCKKTNNNKLALKEQKLQKNTEKKIELTIEPTKPMQVRANTKTKSNRMKQEVAKKADQQKLTIPILIKNVKINGKIHTKATSKIGTGSITSKHSKSSRAFKNNVNVTPIKKERDIKPELNKDKEYNCYGYLPPYLKKRKYLSDQYNLNQSFDSVKVNKDKIIPTMVRSKTEDFKMSLTKFQSGACENLSYLVFRNELENVNVESNSQTADSDNKTENSNKKRCPYKCSSSPRSVNSSPCSTPDSVATIKAITTLSKLSNKRHSASSNKNSVTNLDNDTVQPVTGNRKVSKKCKSNKKAENKVGTNNKENIPETSKIVSPKGEIQNVKSSFFGRKNIFVAQLPNDSGLALNSKYQTPTKSTIKIPAIENTEEKKRPKTATISKKKSILSDDSSVNVELINQDSLEFNNSNKVLLLKPHQENSTVHESFSQDKTSEKEANVVKVIDSNLLTEWLESGTISVCERENTENAILTSMRQIVEERLNFLSNQTIIDSTSLETTNLSLDIDDLSSLKSYKTIVPCSEEDLNSNLKSEIENAMNRSFDAIGEQSSVSMVDETDLDIASFKSVTSTSRYSDYFLADSENNLNEVAPQVHDISVEDIFERKDITVMQNPPGPLAVQAFSGFSMNAEPMIGDQPDYVNLIDSETGSMALDVARQATSEELLVSGRSSVSYESCLIDEDAVVPNWLFQIISQQQSIQEEDHEELEPLPMPFVEPDYDMNGNMVEPSLGLGAGAGDGVGMHSDDSQDSSGRGSSLSTTDTSSGQQSEFIIIDPSAYAAQSEPHEPIDGSLIVTTVVRPSDTRDGEQGDENVLSTSRNVAGRTLANPPLFSDNEADISSIDTDVPDYSDN